MGFTLGGSGYDYLMHFYFIYATILVSLLGSQSCNMLRLNQPLYRLVHRFREPGRWPVRLGRLEVKGRRKYQLYDLQVTVPKRSVYSRLKKSDGCLELN